MAVTTLSVPEATRDRMLRCAEGLFADHGYAAVSMRELAAACEVTKPALYYHFRDKEALFEECLLIRQSRIGGRIAVAASDRGGSLLDRLGEVAAILLEGLHPVRTQADVAEHLPREARQRIAEGWTVHVTGPLTALFVRAAAAGELRPGVDAAMATRALWGQVMAAWPSMIARDGSTFSIDEPGPGEKFEVGPRAASTAELTLLGVGARGVPV